MVMGSRMLVSEKVQCGSQSVLYMDNIYVENVAEKLKLLFERICGVTDSWRG